MSLVQSVINAGSSANTGSATWVSPTTPGNLLIMGVQGLSGNGTTITTPAGWTKIGATIISGSINAAMFYILNSASRSGAETVASTGGLNYISVFLAEVSGLEGGGALDKNTSATGTAALISSTGTTATTTKANEFLAAMSCFAYSAVSGRTQGTPQNSFAIEQQAEAGIVTQGYGSLAFLDQIVSATGAYVTGATLSGTLPVTETYAGIIATFKSAPTSIAPSAGALTVAGAAAKLGLAESPNAGALALSGIAGKLGLNLIPGAGQLLLQGTQPIPGDSASLTPLAGALALAGLAASPILNLLPVSGGDWEVRIYNAAGKRIKLPQGWIESIECEVLERGGCGNGSLKVLTEWNTLPLVGTERADVYLFGKLVYRGWLNLPKQDIAVPELAAPGLFGFMEKLNGYEVTRKYLYGRAVDVSTCFADLISDYVTTAGRFPNAVIDAQNIGVKIQALDARGKSVTQALNQLCDLASGLCIWGAEPVAGALQDRLYIRPRATAVSHVYSIGKDVRAFEYPRDLTAIINRLFLKGGKATPPNLAPNPSFEEPSLADESADNLLTNPGFETGDLTGWSKTGDPTVGNTGSGDTPHTGSSVLILDNFNSGNESVWQDVSIGFAQPFSVACWANQYISGGHFSQAFRFRMDLMTGASAILATYIGDWQDAADQGSYLHVTNQSPSNWTAHDYPTATKVRLTIQENPAVPALHNVRIDDVSLWLSGSVVQTSWHAATIGAAKLLSINWIAKSPAAKHGGYCVGLNVGGPDGGGDYVEIRTNPDKRITVKPNTNYVLLVFVRSATVNSFCSVGWEEFKSTGVSNGVIGPTAGGGVSGFWAPTIQQGFTGSDTTEIDIFVRVRGLDPGIVSYYDAFMLVESATVPWEVNDPAFVAANAAGYWSGDNYERVIDVTATDLNSVVGRLISQPLSADAQASITTYGEREAEVSVPGVIDYNSAYAYAVNYFNNRALPKTEAKLSIVGASDVLPLDGTVKLVNLPSPPPALFPARVLYKVGQTIDVEVELGNQRPDIASLLWKVEQGNLGGAK